MKTNEVKLIPIVQLKQNKSKENRSSSIMKIGAEYKWKKGYTGKGVVVAVIDTGCAINHADLKNNIIGGYNFTEEYDGDITIFEDTNGHGTHVAGIIAGSKNGTGIVGVAPDAKLLILKALNRYGGGSISSVVEAIHYAIDWRGPMGEKVRVISLSLGTKTPDPDLHAAIKRAVANNILVVAASGNDGDGDTKTNEHRYPGAFEEVVEVGAINKENKVSVFSNTNEFVDLYAPGEDIYSSYLNNSYATLSGTSMATPHVSGAIALLIEEYEKLLEKELNETEIFQLLMKHTTPINTKENTKIYVLNLKKNPIVSVNEQESTKKLNREMLLKCFCEARKTQAFFTKCLDENSTEEEKEFIAELVKEYAKTSNKILEYCGINFKK
ncbi:hypothetical protein B4113_2479 [Geobacillus sp. B4113_201601]|nr:S8 family peptidase [Geobacillus sp. B4113_201601]KYD24274.1 hypothetical protein B4113_2479 [Geobacillus sp. B4113_201601]